MLLLPGPRSQEGIRDLGIRGWELTEGMKSR